MSPYIYVRGLRHADHTVFGVTKGQKTYWDEQFDCHVAYSSGQQVKRCIMEEIINELGEVPAPITFYYEAPDLKEGEVVTPGDPRFADQLLGGWMIANKKSDDKKSKNKKTEEDEDTEKVDRRTIKRRSPLSISAMRPLHPLLATVAMENISFDRSDKPHLHNHKVVVKGANGKELSDDQIAELLNGADRSLRRKWIQENRRTSGLFVYDVAIDLRTLFSVSSSGTGPGMEPELKPEILKQLKVDNWIPSRNVFGECLIAPQERREQLIPALAKALLNWRITTNQARTYSPMEILAVAVGQNANKITGAIRAKLDDENEKRAKVIVDDSIPEVETFVTLAGGGYFVTHSESHDALEKAEEKLIALMNDFPYEQQLNT